MAPEPAPAVPAGRARRPPACRTTSSPEGALTHHQNVRRGPIDGRYERTVRWKARLFRLRVGSRGYRFELEPPIPVDVLPGRRVYSKPLPLPAEAPRATDSGPSV